MPVIAAQASRTVSLAHHATAVTVAAAPPAAPAPLPETPSGSGSEVKPSGSGWLPEIDGVLWEWKKAEGAVEAWHTPAPRAPRKQRTYLKRAGVKLLAEWQAMPGERRREVIREWIEAARRQKGF